MVASFGARSRFSAFTPSSRSSVGRARDRRGRPQGIAAVTCLEGDAVWDAGRRGLWSADLLDAALGRSHTRNPGDIRQNTRDFVPPPGRPTFLTTPIAFLLEYADGFRGTALILNGAVEDTTIAARIGRDREPVASTLLHPPRPRRGPGSSTPWSFGSRTSSGPPAVSGRADPAPDRAGAFDALLESRVRKGREGSRRRASPRSITKPPPTPDSSRRPSRRGRFLAPARELRWLTRPRIMGIMAPSGAGPTSASLLEHRLANPPPASRPRPLRRPPPGGLSTVPDRGHPRLGRGRDAGGGRRLGTLRADRLGHGAGPGRAGDGDPGHPPGAPGRARGRPPQPEGADPRVPGADGPGVAGPGGGLLLAGAGRPDVRRARGGWGRPGGQQARPMVDPPATGPRSPGRRRGDLE